MTQLSIFVPIRKVDEENRLVYGQVAAEVQDNSGETFDYEGSKPYFQKWSDNAFATSSGKSYGNLRVMHTSKVAGVISSPLDFNDELKTIGACAKVVDDDDWKKVMAGAYTGFSMGGRYVERITKGDEKRYVADPCEISLVDKPCIPTATFDVVKADGLVEHHHFAEEVTAEDGADLAKIAGAQARVPAGSGRGGQFAGKHAGGFASVAQSYPPGSGPGGKETHKEKFDRENAHEYQKNAQKARDDLHAHVLKNPSMSQADQTKFFKERENHHDGARMKAYSKGRNEAAMKDKTAAAAAKAAKKSDTGELNMFVPTNDAMLVEAKELAKADGKTEADWLGYMEAAHDSLVAKHDGAAPGDTLAKADEPAPAADPAAAPVTADGAEPVEKGEKPAFLKDKIDKDKKGDKDDDAKGSEDDDKTKDGDKDKKGEDDDDAKKSDAPEVLQGWQASDGTFYVKKADALAHNETLAKADDNAEPSLADQLRALTADAEKIAKGEVPDVAPEPTFAITKADVVAVVEGPLAKLTQFKDNELVKGMYGVQRLASVVESLGYLQSSCSYDDGASETNSGDVSSKMLESLKSLGDALIIMANESVTELLAYAEKANKADGVDSDPVLDLACDILGLEKSDFTDKLAKRDPTLIGSGSDLLAKFDAANKRADEAVAKAEKLEAGQAEVLDLVKGLQDQMAAIKKLPMGKAPTTSVAKADAPEASDTNALTDLLAKFTPNQIADMAIRASQQNGRNITMPNG